MTDEHEHETASENESESGEAWDFYEASTGEAGKRAMVRIDLAANHDDVVASHGVLLQVRFKFQKPRADGLRDATEAEDVFALEERVVTALAERADAKHVAVITANGFTELIFYVPEAKRAAADSAPGSIGNVAPYELEQFSEPDAAWAKYEELFPNRYAMQTISNRSLLRQMGEHGDDGSVAREVDHLAFFSSEKAVKDAAAALTKSGFRCDEPHEQEDGRWSLQFHRDAAVSAGRADEMVFEIFELIDPFEGDYDGWGSALVLPEK